MSLLTNPWFSAGMGLLASSGPSLTPVNPWRGIGEGLMNAQNAQYAEQHSAYEQMRMQQEQQKMAAEQQRQTQLRAAIQGLPPEQQQLAMASPDNFFKARIEQQFAKPAESVSIKTAGELGLQGYAPETPIEVKMNGGRVVDYTPMTPPAAPQGPTSIQEFERAQQDPAFAAYLERMKAAEAMKIEMNAGDKPISVSDAANLRFPDGSRVRPGTPMSEVYQRGATSVTQAETTESVTDVNIKGYNAELKRAGMALKAANNAYKENPSAENYQTLKAARSSAATALAQRRNTKGEPSGEIVQGAEADLPLPFSTGGVMGSMLGADPIDATLQQIDSLYGLGLYGQTNKPQAAPKTNGTSIFDMYPGLRQ